MSLPPLLRSRRFLPLFLTQFLGAFNDNLIKNALVILATYSVVQSNEDAAQLSALAGGLFILPFFLFSATAGQLADKVDRARLARIVKIAEIVIMVFAAIGFVTHSIGFLLLVLFGMGTHSTFFGPIKYALLPQHLSDDELLSGNAYIESGTFLAILLGTILGGVLIPLPAGELVVSLVLMGLAVSGYIASRRIPPAPAPEPTLTVSRNILKATWRMVGYAREDKKVFACILAISWFWLVGATFLQQFGPFAKGVVHAGASVVTLFLTVFSVGIGAGSLLCNKLLRGRIQSTYVALGALGITLFGIDLYFASSHAARIPAQDLTGFWQFLGHPANWRILLDLFLIAVSGGIFIVPLYAIMQHRSPAVHLARIIAANNVLNALFMVGSAIATLFMVRFGFSIPDIFLSTAVANGCVAMVLYKRDLS